MTSERETKRSGLLADRRGVAGIEFALVAPFLVLLLLGATTLFDAFRASKTADAAGFTIADRTSRQTEVDNTYLELNYELFLRMVNKSKDDVRYRISSLKTVDGVMSVAWSYPVAPMPKLTVAMIPADKLPLMTRNDSLIMLETWTERPSLFDILGTFADLYLVNFTRPRFSAEIKKV